MTNPYAHNSVSASGHSRAFYTLEELWGYVWTSPNGTLKCLLNVFSVARDITACGP